MKILFEEVAMSSRIRRLMNLLTVGTLVVLSQSCTVIGLTMGAASDHKKPDYRTVVSLDSASREQNPRMITTTVKPGKKIIVITRDQQTIQGIFDGTTGQDDELALQIIRTPDTITIPVKNVSRIQMRNEKYGTITGLLVGAALDGVAVMLISKSMEDSMKMDFNFE